MQKRILSFILALSMVITAIPSVLAAKKDYSDEQGNVNIYSWGGFDTAEDLTLLEYNSGNGELITSGQKSGAGALKVNCTHDYGTVKIPAPLEVGETYDISFDVKTDAAPSTMSLYISFDQGGYQFIATNGSFNKEWTHFETSWTNNGMNAAGTLTDGKGVLSIRYGTGLERVVYYVDNFSVVPHGNVPGDYSSIEMKSTGKKEEVKKEENAVNEVVEIAFSDMENHWAKEAVNTLATYGYIDGMGNNLYAPQGTLTRAQFVKMIVDTYRLIVPAYDSDFIDVAGDEWFAGYVTAADKLGLLDPVFVAGRAFQGDRPITREEAAVIASKAAMAKNAERKTNVAGFKDSEDVASWASKGVTDAAEYGLINGYENGTYQPKNTITRAEAAQILLRVAELTTKFNIYVDQKTGDDNNDGTVTAPLKTVAAASKMVRKYNKTMANDICVKIRGEQYLDKTLALTNEDGGFNGYTVRYTSWGDEKANLTMGQKFTGFELYDAEKNIYRVFVGKGVETRQAYFNGLKGIRSRSVAGLKNVEYNKTDWYYDCDNTELLDFAYPTEVELVYHIAWTKGRSWISGVEDLGDGRVRVLPNREKFAKQADRIEVRAKGDDKLPSYLENAYELLDAENEWYMNSHDGFMYYIPAKGENMETMELTVPMGEMAVSVKGTSAKEPVKGITFDNLVISDTTYLQPNRDRVIIPNQNNMYSGNSVHSEPVPPAVLVENAQYINFTNNEFTRIGSVGLTTQRAIQHCNIIGNEFYDISGTAVFLGTPGDSELPGSEEEFNQYNKVNNNYIHNIATDYSDSAAISTGWPRYSQINHNEIANIPYTAIHVGWGWALFEKTGTAIYDLEIAHNYIREVQNDRIYDGGGIYTVCATSKEAANNKNRIKGNYFENMRNAYAAVYPDEGSTNWHIYDNVTDLRDVKSWEYNFSSQTRQDEFYWFMIHTGTIQNNILEDNYSTHPNIRYNASYDINEIHETYGYPDAEWPEAAQDIINTAGIEDAYKANFDLDAQRTFISETRGYTVGKGESVQLDMKVMGRHLEEYDLSDYDVKYYVSHPDLLTVDENGLMYATGKGTDTVWVWAVVNMDGVLQTKTFRVVAGDDVEKLELNANTFNMIAGYEAPINAFALTTSGQRLLVDKELMTFKSSDTNVVTIGNDGILKAVGAGDATVSVTAEYKGVKLSQEIPVKIITYTQPDSLELPYETVPANFFSSSSWRGGGEANGNALKVTGSPNFYTVAPIENKLIAFDMSINNPNSWPSLTLCAQNITMGNFQTDSTYLIGFKSDYIEMQRFNDGVRTMIFGDGEYSPVGGPGVPNKGEDKFFEYGKTYSIIVGTLDTEEGTRIVLTVNGKNVFDYLDTDENALKASGYFGIYNSGDFTFSPYTGRTE